MLYRDFMSIEINSSEDTTSPLERDLNIYGPEGKLDPELKPADRPGVYDVAGARLTTRFVSIAEAFPDKPIPPLDLC
jgi:hypothetical protein